MNAESSTNNVIADAEPHKIIQELLSQKFIYFGDTLNDKIQTIKNKKSFQELTGIAIKEYLSKESQDNHFGKKEDIAKVTIFIENNETNDETLRKNLIASAYFPEELDPQTKTSPLVSLSKFKFIHRQLADAFCYGHPLARKFLKEIISVCNVPLSNDHNIYNNFYHIRDDNLENYNAYVLLINLPNINNDTNDNNINKKITFRPYSLKSLIYFQKLLSPSGHPEMRKQQQNNS
jgi:hypothetical protein